MIVLRKLLAGNEKMKGKSITLWDICFPTKKCFGKEKCRNYLICHRLRV